MIKVNQLLLCLFLLVAVTASAQSTTYSLRFWGVSDYVQVPNCSEVQLTGDMTIIFDIRIKNTTDLKDIICMGSDTSVTITGNNLYKLQLAAGGTKLIYSHEYSNSQSEQVNFNWNLAFDAWQQVAIIRDSVNKELKLYVEGTLVETQSYTYQPQGGVTDQLSFGHALGAASNYLNSLLDNISIWDYVMPDSMVFLLSQCLPNGSESGLVGYWNFDEGVGIVVNDMINNNDGILYPSSLNWRTQHRDYYCTLDVPELKQNKSKEVVRIVDPMGRQVEDQSNTVLIYIYSDGSVQRIFRCE